MSTPPITIGCRKSALSLVQADQVSAKLRECHPGESFNITTAVVQGDADKVSPFLQMVSKTAGTDAGKNLWTSELEESLRQGNSDLLVHCLKDLPTVIPDGFILGAIMEREDPSDALICKEGLPYRSLSDLPAGSVVGTSSIRRKALLMLEYPNLIPMECRGNIDSRIKKLDAASSPFTCIILATAGLVRLNLTHRITQYLREPQFPHAVGQGALGIEIRSNDAKMMNIISVLNHHPSRMMCIAERSLLRHLQGGCSSPVAVATSFNASKESGDENEGIVSLEGQIIHPHGTFSIKHSLSAKVANDFHAEQLGIAVADGLLALGATDLMKQIGEINKYIVSDVSTTS